MIHGEGEKWRNNLFLFQIVLLCFSSSYSLSLVDAIDTLATLDNSTEFSRVYTLIQNLDIERDINVSVFETNIRGIVLEQIISSMNFHLVSYMLFIMIDW